MFVAKEKKEENIAEYILYMWQIEDLIRASQLNLDAIQQNIIAPSSLSPDKKKQLLEWYSDLIEMMRAENIQQTGHLQFVSNVLGDLIDLHYALVKSQKHADYTAQLYKALPYMADFIRRSEVASHAKDEIEGCFIFLYGVLLLRLQRKPLTQETKQAFAQISKLIALLSLKYKQFQLGALDPESLS